jgi:hypothetical protein
MSGPSEGDLSDVIELGLKLAQEAIDRGDEAYAEAILSRVRVVKKEHEIAAKEKELTQLQKQLERI